MILIEGRKFWTLLAVITVCTAKSNHSTIKPTATPIPLTYVLLNEIYFDTSADHNMADFEFIELHGPAGYNLKNVTLALYSDNATTFFTLSLSNHSLNDDGYFLLGGASVNNTSWLLTTELLQSNLTAAVLYKNPPPGFQLSPTREGLLDFLIYGVTNSDKDLISKLSPEQRPVHKPARTKDQPGFLQSASRCGSNLVMNQRAFHQGKRTPGQLNDCPGPNSLHISEVSVTGRQCYIEILSDEPSFSLDQFVLVTFSDDRTLTDEVDLDLWTRRTDKNGIFLAQSLPNNSTAVTVNYTCEQLTQHGTIALVLLRVVVPPKNFSIDITDAEVLDVVSFNTTDKPVDESMVLEELSQAKGNKTINLHENLEKFLNGKLSINWCGGTSLVPLPLSPGVHNDCPSTQNSAVTPKSTAAVSKNSSSKAAVPTNGSSMPAVPTNSSSATVMPTNGSPMAAVATSGSSTATLPTNRSSTTIVPTNHSSTTIVPTNHSSTTIVPTNRSSTTIMPTTGSSTTALPTNGSSTATIPRSGSSTATMPTNGSSTATMLPNGSSTATMLTNGSSTATMPTNGSSTATMLTNGLSTATMLTNGSSTATMPTNGSSTATMLTNGSSTATMLTNGSSTATLPTNGSSTATLPTNGSSTATLPTNHSSTAIMPTNGSSTAIMPTNASSTAIMPTNTSSTAIMPTNASSTAIMPTNGSSTAIMPTNGSSTAIMPTNGSSTAIMPTNGSSTATMPTNGSSTAAMPTNGSSTAAMPTNGSSTAAMPTNGSSTAAMPTTITGSPGSTGSSQPQQATVVINEVKIDVRVRPQTIELKGQPNGQVAKYAILIKMHQKLVLYAVNQSNNNFNNHGYLTITISNSTKKSSTTQIIALYDITSWTEDMKQRPNFTSDGLVDAVMFSSSNVNEDVKDHQFKLTQGSAIIKLDTSKYDNYKEKGFSISRCSDKPKTSSAFAVTCSSPNVDNKGFCPSSNYSHMVEMYLKNADCDIFKNNQTLTNLLTEEIVRLMNIKCQCGFTAFYLDDVKLVCGSVIFKAVLIAIDDDKKQVQYNNFIEVIKETKEIQVAGRSYPLKPCYVNCDKPGMDKPSDNVKVTVAVVVSCLIVFLIIVVLVIFYMTRKKRGLLNFRMKRLDESDDELIGDIDDFVGGHDATFDTSAYSRLTS